MFKKTTATTLFIMADVEKDVETLEQMHATGSDSLNIMASLSRTVVRVFYERIKRENPALSEQQVLKKLNEELFYGRRDNC